MKKIKDKSKVSNFKNREVDYHYHSSFCMKTKPNNLYFKRELKKITTEMRENLCTEELKKKDPHLYYCMMDRKLPKKYLKKNYPIAPVNAYVPPQSKLSKEELDKQLEEERLVREQKEKALKVKKETERKEKERRERNRAAIEKERRYVFWSNAYDQGNYVSIHSDQYKKKEKKYEYY